MYIFVLKTKERGKDKRVKSKIEQNCLFYVTLILNIQNQYHCMSSTY